MSDNPSKSLIDAVIGGHFENARSLIKKYGLSYSEVWSNGYYLLSMALENKRSNITELLLTSGAEVNFNGEFKPIYLFTLPRPTAKQGSLKFCWIESLT